ncbi:general transcriptional corepressor CYC8 [Copidosoma floridanum]|uniref:general transcriptional corepressor CYC8 n=1 Tax=Copidosoma floridanum TaxID=29053 RepID=UPI0006C9C4DA|nr:general transcriptional corepressor CYC8 [Copidosoma floridanum]
MKIATTLFFFVVVGCTWRESTSTLPCVVESDFGFTLVCSFKKSGIFRIRNLGGFKGYFGLGFTVGDELGFQDSLTNLEVSRRRSVQTSRSGIPGLHPNVVREPNSSYIHIHQTSRYSFARIRNRMAVPPFKPLPPGASRPMAQQPERQRLVVQQNFTSSATAPRLPTASQMINNALLQEEAFKQQQQRAQQEAKMREQQRLQQEMLAMQVLKQQRQQQQEAMKFQRQQQQVQFPQQALPMAMKRTQQSSGPARMPSIVAAVPQSGGTSLDKILQMQNKPMVVMAIPPAFVRMPESAAQLTDRISNSPTILEESVNEVAPKDDASQIKLKLPSSDDMASSVNQMTLMSLQPIASVENPQAQTQEKRQSMPSLPSLAPIQGMETSLKALAEASNITLEALEAAILLRQQQLLEKQQGPATTTTTTTSAPVKKPNNVSGATKVMNAPREYYPVGYDKNFDDNFASRVDLPDTSFYCGDQKHFPGLYADEDLGCMVFHVCALTDDGLIMKSFLCPESTLFDQTILKCNWWFYIDCKTSKGLYDSNIPISKSYQLMKALAFFSAYKSHDNSTQIANNGDS